MADVNATFVYDADFTSAVTQVRALSRELSTLNNSFNSLDKDARKVRDRFAEVFKADIGDLGAFSARTVDITSNMDNFGKALDRNKLKLRDYAREARKAFQENSNSRKLAEDQVRRTKADLVDLGMDANGRRKGILVTPLRLDMSDMQTQIEVARKQFSIFNKLVNDGATQLINWGKNTQWAGRQLTVGLTVPMTMFATTTIKAFNDVDRELTRFQKVYGSDLVGSTTQATNAIRAQVQALAVDIAGSFGIAAKETAGLAADLAATGLEGQKLLDSIKQTTRLSVLGEIDRQDAMKTTLSLQNAFNMSTQELAESINFLNAVENQTSLSLQDLTEAIPKVGPVVRALGGDVKDLSVLMVAMKEGGINAAEGANALKSGLASLINPTKAGSEVAKQYGIDLEEIVKKNKGQLLPTVLEFQKSMQTLDDLGKAKIIEQLFGKYQFARISALFDNLNTAGSQTKQVIELMSASNSDLAKVANEEIKVLTESASMRFQRSMEAIKAALLPVGETIVNSVLPFMERLAGVFDRVISFAQNLPGPVKSFLKVVTGITAIAGPLIMMTGVLGNFLGYIVKGAMAFVNLGRTIRGLPTEKFELLDDAQIAAAKATDTVTLSIERQKDAMIGLNQIMMDYYTLINKQKAKTPNLFTAPVEAATPAAQSSSKPRPGPRRIVIKRQMGGSAWVPGSGSGDKIPALLEPGEFVINRNAAKQYGGVLEDINNGVPRFQSGGKIPGFMAGGPRRPGWRLRREAGEDQAPVRQAAQQPNRPELMQFKDWNPRQISALSAGENFLINNLFLKANKPSTRAARDAILRRIQEDRSLSESDKAIFVSTLSRGENVRDVSLQREFSRILQQSYNDGDFDELSNSLKAQILTTIELGAARTRQTQTYAEVNPMLTETIRKTREEYGSKIRSRPREWSVEDTSKSFYSGYDSRETVSMAHARIVQRLKDTGVSDNEAERLANAYVYGIKRNTTAESFHAAHQSGGVIQAQNGGLIKAMFGMRIPRSKRNTPYSGQVASSLTPNVSKKDQDLLDLYFDKPQVGHLDNLQKTPLGEIASRGMVPSQTLYRGMSDFDMNLVKQSGTLTRDSVMSTTRDREAAIKIASGLSDSGGGNTYSVAKIKVGRGTRGVHLNSLVPRARQSLDEILLSPQTPLHFRRSEIGYRINTGESIIPVMQHVFSTKKPNMIQRLYDRILQSRQSELRPLTREEVRYWQQAGAPLTEGMQLVANRGKTIYGDNYEENYQKAQASKRVADAAAAERARKASLTPEESRAEYLAAQAAVAARSNYSGVQTGGMIRAQEGMNTAAWVPGKGEGDRVPALLEPGEFVVNKKAAKQYGGMLEDLNWNVAPRFMRGTPPGMMPGMTTGAVSGGLMAASMASSMMLPVNKFTEALNKSIMALSAFTGILSAIQMLGGRMGGGIGGKLSGIMTPKPGTSAAYSARQGVLAKEAGMGLMKQGGLKNKASGASLLGRSMMLKSAGATAALLTNPIGLAIIATTALVAATLKYKKSLDSAKKSAEQAFGASKAEAEAFGVELKNVGETIKANQEYTKMIGAQAQQSQSTSQRLDPEKEAALLGANEDLTKRLRNLSETKLTTTFDRTGDRSAQAATVLTAKYASLLQQGFSENDANVMVRTLAKASGAMDAYAQSVNKFGMIKADDPASIIKAQMEGVKTFQNIGGLFDQGERGGFAAGIKAVVEQINLLPPEDQYTGLKTLLSQIENLDTRQLKVAQQSIIDMTKETYGEGSQLFNTQRAIQERTSGSFSFKNLSTYDDFISKVGGSIENELATSVSAALTSAFETGAITDQQLKDYQLRIEADPSSISQIETELDIVTRDRQIKIEATIKLEEQLAEQYEKINKEIIIKQNDLQSAIEAKNAAIEKEEEAFKKSQKAGQKFIKGKQEEIKVIDEKASKEIEAIEKQTDTYLKSLTKQDDANKFRAEQRGTMLGGLGALAEGDVFGFLDARQEAEENARQFSASEEIKVIEEKKQAAVDAIDLERDKRIEAIQIEIDKKQEALEKQAEGHEAHMARLQKERDTMATNASKTIAEMQATSDSIAGIKSNPVILDWLTNMKDKAKAAAAQAALINYLVKHPEATVAEAFRKVQADLLQSDQSFQSGMNSNQGERAGGAGSGGQYNQVYTPTTSANSSGMTGGRSGRAPGYTAQANGGYISGPGTSTSDSIPARLSNGEYVVKASAVNQYGVGMMNSINEQRFADGGQVLDDYSRVTYGGKTFNARTVRMLKRAEESYGSGFGFYQGSYSTGVSASMGTHDGGGAVDIKPPANIDKALKALAAAGFWAKWRGSMNPPHIHALATGDAQLSSAARRQLGLPADGGYQGDQVEVGTRTVESAIKEAAAAGYGTVKELTDIMANGAAAVYAPLTGRKFGGSMTMNKPYLVGENGPEVVMPYGSGSRVDPKFNVPSGSSIATVSQGSSDIINSNSYSNMVVNLSVSGVNDPNKAANKVIEIINSQASRRNHSRKMGR